jgi:hypothetical protein
MATPADQRLLELIEKWLASLELHAEYCSLDDESYARVRAWPEHQRPSRWIVDLAKQKALALQAQLRARIEKGDDQFAESLELMIFLANLVGSEHIERYIPLAEPAHELVLGLKPADGQSTAATGTREMPRFPAGGERDPMPVGTSTVARTERRGGSADKALKAEPPAAGKTAKPAHPPPRHERDGPSEEAREQVIADAARLVQWGRKWYELAELIASMANRPHLTDVRRILKDNKSVIDERAGRT